MGLEGEHDNGRTAAAADFLRRIFGQVPRDHLFNIWSTPTKGAGRFFTVADVDRAAQHVAQLDAAVEQVYFSVCPHRQRPASGRGTHETVSCVPALWVDVDLRPPAGAEAAHKADAAALPPDADAVLDLLDEIPELPPPSLVVGSGYGVHLYWNLSTPLERERGLEAVKALQAAVRAPAERRGWHLDNTADLARVLRVAGSRNRKVAGLEPDVAVLYDSGDAYDPQHLLAAVAGSKPRPAGKLAVAVAARRGAPAADAPPLDESRTMTIDEVRRKLGRIRKAEQVETVRRLLKGESIADPGERDRGMQRATSIVAFATGGHTPAAMLVELFRPMLEKWAAEPGAKLTIDEEIDKALDKLERAGADARRKEAAARAEAEAWQASAAQKTAEVAHTLGVSADEAGHRYIIQKATGYYLLQRDGDYIGPFLASELLTAARDHLAWAPVRLDEPTKDGRLRRRKPEELMHHYGTVAREVQVDMTAERSRFDAAPSIFFEAACRPRTVEPRYHADVAEWFFLFGGAHVAGLSDWVASAHDLSRPTCALFFTGPDSVGKGMFAAALARLWTAGAPAKLGDVIGNFNGDIARCPLVICNEGLPPGATSAVLRDLIGESTHVLTRKHLPTASINGCLRLVFMANNPAMISFPREHHEAADVNALGRRILHIEVPQEAADYLRDMGGRTATSDWVTGDRIAEFFAWLRANRAVHLGDRFLVEGHAQRMAERIASRSGVTPLVLHYLVRALSADLFEPHKADGLHVGDGRILINTEYLHQTWRWGVDEEHTRPKVGIVGQALKSISHPRPTKIPNASKRAWSVKPEAVLAFAEEHQLGDIDVMRARIDATDGAATTAAPDAGAQAA